MKVDKRGPAPLGGGQVYFTCPIVRMLSPVTMIDEGKVRRIRGLCHTSKCAPQLSARVIESSRGVLNNLLPDVHIYTQHFKGKNAGGSPGYAISLVAETTTGVFYSSEVGTQSVATSSSISPVDAKSAPTPANLSERMPPHSPQDTGIFLRIQMNLF